MTPQEFEDSGRLLEILNDPVFAKTIAKLMDETITDWTNETSPAKREELWHQHGAIRQIVSRMEWLANAPKLEARKTDLRAKHN